MGGAGGFLRWIRTGEHLTKSIRSNSSHAGGKANHKGIKVIQLHWERALNYLSQINGFFPRGSHLTQSLSKGMLQGTFYINR